jgi:dTDP-4-amino-4,6-dideoxygalactose transaminase
MLMKNGWQFTFTNEKWKGYYNLTDRVIDAAVYWKKDGYIPGTLMCHSFFKSKHLSTDRGGIILLDDKDKYDDLIKLVYDGRDRSDIPFYKQKCGFGYHYYMTSENAKLGLQNFEKVKDKDPIEKNWDWYTPVNQYSTEFDNLL